MVHPIGIAPSFVRDNLDGSQGLKYMNGKLKDMQKFPVSDRINGTVNMHIRFGRPKI